eukprot:TRINITY_DN1560_c0_g1_i1.p1 TRINITY_DN1560_c0_g1~~TRINITY_DN1560_c0_g1_i1.p1  ORF type:complete len:221 (+),score=35.39 TRINITY_DN1560_c0_g1_i1:99-761(+)
MAEEVKETKKRGRPAAKKQKTEETNASSEEVKLEVSKEDKAAKEEKVATEGKGDESAEAAEDVFEVESVHGRCMRNGKLQYLLKWKGYPTSENTWEDEDNIFSKDLLQEYDEKEKQKAANKATRKGAGKGSRRQPEAAQDVEQNVRRQPEAAQHVEQNVRRQPEAAQHVEQNVRRQPEAAQHVERNVAVGKVCIGRREEGWEDIEQNVTDVRGHRAECYC